MLKVANLGDKLAAEAEMPVDDRWSTRTLYEQLCETARRFPERPAVSFQLRSSPSERSATLSWSELRAQVTQLANLLRHFGIGPGDTVAYVLPNGVEAPLALLAGATAGIVNPINPLLNAETIAGILRETDARLVVTLAPFPKSDLAQKVAEAVALTPRVNTILQVDLRRYLGFPLSMVVPFLRPRTVATHNARVLDLHAEMARERKDVLDFEETRDNRVCAYFHTGGTTGLPKIARHRASGILYNGWCGASRMFNERDLLFCPLPMFHVLAAYPIFMSCLMSGAHLLMVTPQGYRGDGVFQNFWKLVERWKVSFIIFVPTAAARLMQVPLDADVSTLRLAISGSAAMPTELFERFEKATGVTILEGYGMTEATCLISINPPDGVRKIGSVGLPFPYTHVRILRRDTGRDEEEDCKTDEVGEICVKNPGVGSQTYTDSTLNRNLLTQDGYLHTGDLGRVDADGYIWITGRAKDLIIRSGHNIDPVLIEEALMAHPEVSFVGAIGQPDAHSGEVPAAYVELIEGSKLSDGELVEFARARIAEKAAVPKHLEIMTELPKTAVGKVFKPELRRRAIARVYDAALQSAGLPVRVAEVTEDKRLGLVAVLVPDKSERNDAGVDRVLGRFLTPWRWQDDPGRKADQTS